MYQEFVIPRLEEEQVSHVHLSIVRSGLGFDEFCISLGLALLTAISQTWFDLFFKFTGIYSTRLQGYEARVEARNKYGWSEHSQTFYFFTGTNSEKLHAFSIEICQYIKITTRMQITQ